MVPNISPIIIDSNLIALCFQDIDIFFFRFTLCNEILDENIVFLIAKVFLGDNRN